MATFQQNCFISFIFLGTFASFNWDTTSTAVLTTTTAMDNAHLSNQNYNICIRRVRGYCSICYSPHVLSANNDEGSSFGVSASNTGSAPTAQSVTETVCTGRTSTGPAPDNAANIGIMEEYFTFYPDSLKNPGM